MRQQLQISFLSVKIRMSKEFQKRNLFARVAGRLRWEVSKASGRIVRGQNAARVAIDEFLARFDIRMPRKVTMQLKTTGTTGILFPDTKEYAGALHLRICGSGFKDKVYIHLATVAAYCLHNNLYLDWDGDLEGYGGWSEWFMPFQAPSRQEFSSKIEYTPNWVQMSQLGRSILNRYPPTLIRNLWRLNHRTRSHIDIEARKLNLNDSIYAAVQVRRGDKLRIGQVQSISASTIAKAIEDRIESNRFTICSNR